VNTSPLSVAALALADALQISLAQLAGQVSQRGELLQLDADRIDVDDLDRAMTFWSEALGATEEQVSAGSRHVYRTMPLT
jgi:hypothetical protein